MKKIFLLIFCFCLCVCSACSNKPESEPISNNMADTSASANSLNLLVTKELENLGDLSGVDDETIKALSVVSRTNIINSGEYEENLEAVEYTPKSEHIYNLVNATSGEVLSLENSDEKIDTIYIDIKEEQTPWQKEIKKVDVLKFMQQNNITLANISDIELETTDDGFAESILIGGKTISVKTLMHEFDLPSTKITNIKNKLSSILVEGVGKGNEQNFELKEAQKFAEKGQNYKKILKNRYNNFQIITNN